MAEQYDDPVKAEADGDILVLTLLEKHFEGDIVAESLRERMQRALSESACSHAVIDFQHVEYISSVAFRPLLALRRNLIERQGRMVVCGLNPVVGDVFFTTRMVNPEGQPAPMFELQSSVQEAIQSLRSAVNRSKDPA